MSVLIKGMEMPTNTDMAPTAVWVYPNGYAVVFKDNGNMQQYTQAVPVPPHGRLIDADALDNAFTGLRWDNDGLAHWGDRKDWCLRGSEIEALISGDPSIILEEGE